MFLQPKSVKQKRPRMEKETQQNLMVQIHGGRRGRSSLKGKSDGVHNIERHKITQDCLNVSTKK